MFKKGLITSLYSILLLIFLVLFSPNVNAVTSVQPKQTHQEELRKELSINMPIRTNDPSLSITFVPPNTKTETSIQVDEKVFQNVKSPFVLPALSIGEHSITFKYRSKEGALKILVETILVTPKSPIFDADIPVEGKVDQKISLHGISIPSGIINIIHNSQNVVTTKADETGKWKIESSPLILGKNNFIAQVDKNGYISTFSKPISLNVGTQSLITNTLINNNIVPKKSFADYWQDLQNWIKKNQDQAVILGGALGSITITIIIYRLFIGTKKRRKDRTIRDILNDTRDKEQNLITKLSATVNEKNEKLKKNKKPKKKVKAVTKKKTVPKGLLKKSAVIKKHKSKKMVEREAIRLQKKENKKSVIFKNKAPSTKNSSTKDVPENKNGKEPNTVASVTKSLTKEEFLKKFKQS